MMSMKRWLDLASRAPNTKIEFVDFRYYDTRYHLRCLLAIAVRSVRRILQVVGLIACAQEHSAVKFRCRVCNEDFNVSGIGHCPGCGAHYPVGDTCHNCHICRIPESQ